jgi:RNA polymerase sigma-54 factor
MALTQRLDLRQGQSLVLTPQLQQAIKLLQMSNLELQAFVDGELERNPLLERDETAIADPVLAEQGISGSASSSGAGGDLSSSDDGLRMPERQDARRERSGENGTARLQGDADSGWTGLRAGAPPEAFGLESRLSREPSLAEHLIQQLRLAVSDPAERLIGAHLIGMVDEAGYLTADLETVAEMLGASLAQVEKTLATLQTFEPTGVFARSVSECLALQLKERDRLDPAMAALLSYLDLVARRDLDRLRKLCGVDLDDLKDMIAEIRRLDPKPGNAFGNVVVQPIVPDVFVRPGRDGNWNVELNSNTLPRVLVNSRYDAVVATNTRSEDDRVYVSECYKQAAWLIKSLDQRARTILAVSREIVRRQELFLVHGIEALKPLNLRDVAEAIGVHESTVSRVAANKYMATPRGTFEVKYFFATPIAAADGGEAHSSEAVRYRIGELIAAEAADKVLSDDMIADRLRAAGIDIARRTVAKYREALGIGSSAERRRERRMAERSRYSTADNDKAV